MSVIKKHICGMSAYLPPLEGRDPEKYALLDFNERTLPVSEKIQHALIEYIQSGRLQMYPAYGDIVERLSQYAGVDSSQLMITNGSDQGIELVFRSVCSVGDKVIIPGPTFAMYNQCAKIENCQIVAPIYDKEKGYPLAEVVESIDEQVKLVVISNPNNPCGTMLAREGVRKVLEAASAGGANAAVLVDECYFEYSRVTVSDWIAEYPNLIITRTFSKTWGIPSLRFGYILSCEQNITALLNVRGPYDINQLAVVAAKAALEDSTSLSAYTQEVMNQSKPLLERTLEELDISFWPSTANYIWMFPDNPVQLEQRLRDAQVLVRPKANANGDLGLRVTLGSLSQVEKVIDVIRAFR